MKTRILCVLSVLGMSAFAEGAGGLLFERKDRDGNVEKTCRIFKHRFTDEELARLQLLIAEAEAAPYSPNHYAFIPNDTVHTAYGEKEFILKKDSMERFEKLSAATTPLVAEIDRICLPR